MTLITCSLLRIHFLPLRSRRLIEILGRFLALALNISVLTSTGGPSHDITFAGNSALGIGLCLDASTGRWGAWFFRQKRRCLQFIAQIAKGNRRDIFPMILPSPETLLGEPNYTSTGR